MIKAEQLLRDTADIVSGPRDATHGDKVRSFNHIARLWSSYLQRDTEYALPITARDVAVMMTLLKVARMDFGNFNIDDYNDALGYMAIAGEIQQDAEAAGEEVVHRSDCATNNMPAMPAGKCNCFSLEIDEMAEMELEEDRTNLGVDTDQWVKDNTRKEEPATKGYVDQWVGNPKTIGKAQIKPGYITASEVQKRAKAKQLHIDQKTYDICILPDCMTCKAWVKDGRVLPKPGTTIPLSGIDDAFMAPVYLELKGLTGLTATDLQRLAELQGQIDSCTLTECTLCDDAKEEAELIKYPSKQPLCAPSTTNLPGSKL